MRIPQEWTVKCPKCQTHTHYQTTFISLFHYLELTCLECGNVMKIRPTKGQWNEWWNNSLDWIFEKGDRNGKA